MTKALSKSGFARVDTNLQRYKPSGVFYARFKVGGEIIKKSLTTTVLTVARLRLRDLITTEEGKHQDRLRAGKTKKGHLTVRGATDIFLENQRNLVATRTLKPRSLEHNLELIKSIEKTWPDLMARDVTRVSPELCKKWASKFRSTGTQFKNQGAKNARTGISSQRFNGAVRILRRILEVAVEESQLNSNPVRGIKMMPVRTKHLVLPTKSQFRALVQTIRDANARYSRACADMVCFLAYAGCRISEARRILFKHINWEAKYISVLGDPDTGTKNWETRLIPLGKPLRELIEAIQRDRPEAGPDSPVLMVRTCQSAINRACTKLGIDRFTHHDLRHLFITTCLESRIDISTIATWVGHKDKGALLLKRYGHLRPEHLSEAADLVKWD
jgi:integrase